MSTISTTLQAITKLAVLFIYSEKLCKILKLVWYDFWPADICGPKINAKLDFYNKIIIFVSIMMFTSGIFYAFGFLSSPLIFGKKILPFEAVYPFNWSKSPYYEIIYVLEWMTNIAFILVGICGHDFLFVGLCSNIVAQFVLLGEALGYLGSRNINEFNRKLEQVTQVKFSEEPNLQLINTCIVHHVKITETCEKVAEIFSFSCFIQLSSSVTALCLGALLMTLGHVDPTLFAVASCYIFGHSVQLFLFATLGNEVIDYARKLPTAIFNSQWYNTDLHVQKDVLFVIERAQKDVKFSAMGIKDLDYQTFIEVLRLSFSFYTMLSKVTDH